MIALLTLVISAMGILLAVLIYGDLWWVALLVALALVIGWVASYGLGWHRLRADDPVGALPLLERGILVGRGLLAAVGGLAIIVIAVTLGKLPDDPESKALVAAATAAALAFVGAVFTKGVDDPDSAWIAPTVRRLFREQYGERIAALRKPDHPPGDGEQALQSEHWGGRGWGSTGRRRRAEAIAAALRPVRERQR